MASGYTLDRDSLIALARLLKERGIGNQVIERNVIDSWPACCPARVTEDITVRDANHPGQGKAKLLRSDQVVGTPESQEINLIAGDDTEEIDVYRLTKSNGSVALDTEGYVIQDRSGKHWWIEEPTKLVRFILEEDLAAGGAAGASIVSSGFDDGESIEIFDWAGNTGKNGDQGVAWKDGDTYRVIEIKSKSSELLRFTLEEDIDTASHLAGASIVSDGPDDGESIEVTDWCLNGGKAGDHGIAWKELQPKENPTDPDVYIYWIIEITAGYDYIHFKWDSDSNTTYASPLSPQSVTSILPNGADGESIEVIDPHYLAIQAKAGMTGVAVKTPGPVDTPWTIIASQTLPQFITGKVASGGYTFGTASAAYVTLTGITGVDKPWVGENTFAENPHSIKVWMDDDDAGPCLLRCQYNANRGNYEIVEAMNRYIMHGVAITDGCVFQQLTFAGAQHWSDATKWSDRKLTEADWVTSVYVENMELVYDERCIIGNLIIDLTECPPSGT